MSAELNDFVSREGFLDVASGSVSVNSSPIDMRKHRHCAIELLQTGTYAGTATLQGSNTYNVPGEAANWASALDSAGNAITMALAGSTGEAPRINVSDVNYRYLRLAIVRSGGTGALSGVVTRKN